jgi:hypothetical protein
MPRINAVTLDQINRQIDILDTVHNQVSQLQSDLAFTQQQAATSDPIHAPSTTNNLSFSWSGSGGAISWAQGFIKDKNWSAQTTTKPAIKSSAPGVQHTFTVPAGSLTLSPNTYYWLGWDPTHQQMLASTDASTLHGNYNVHVICQIYTGTSGQSGTAGGGGSNGGVDLSGLTYKNF